MLGRPYFFDIIKAIHLETVIYFLVLYQYPNSLLSAVFISFLFLHGLVI